MRRYAASARAADVPRVLGFAEDHLPHTILHPAQFRDIWSGEASSPERELAAAILEAAAAGVSVNAWLVRAITRALDAGPGKPPRIPRGPGTRFTGYARG